MPSSQPEGMPIETEDSSSPVEASPEPEPDSDAQALRPTPSTGAAATAAERRAVRVRDVRAGVMRVLPSGGRRPAAVGGVGARRRRAGRTGRGRAAPWVGSGPRRGEGARDGRLGAEAGGHAVEEHREDDDGQARLEAERDVDARQRRDDVVAEAAGADHARDDDHGERQHDDLVDAGHDRRQGERELDLAQDAARRGAERVPGLDDLGVHLPDAELGEPDAGSHGEDDRRDDPRHGAGEEDDDGRDEVDERRHGLHEVEHRPHDRGDAVVARGPDAERDGEEQRDRRRQQDEREGVHRVAPLVDAGDDDEPDERAERQLPALDEEREGGEHGGDAPARRARQDRVERVVDADEDVLDEAEQGAERRRDPADERVDPVAEGDAGHERVGHAAPPSVEATASGAVPRSISPVRGWSAGTMASSSVTRGTTPTSRPSASVTGTGGGGCAGGAEISGRGVSGETGATPSCTRSPMVSLPARSAATASSSRTMPWSTRWRSTTYAADTCASRIARLAWRGPPLTGTTTAGRTMTDEAVRTRVRS